MECIIRKPGLLAQEMKIEYLCKQVRINRSNAFARTDDNSTALWEILYTFYPIAEFLAPIEVIGLAYLHKKFKLDKRMKKWYTMVFEMNMKDLLTAKGHPLLADQLNTIPKPWPFVISGSAVLQALLSESWPSYDIDIYGRTEAIIEVEKLLRENRYVSFYNPNTEDRYIQLEATKSIKRVMDWHNLERKMNNNSLDRPCIVQIIELRDHIDYASDCVKYFDLSVVKNSWNGKSIYVDEYKSLVTKTSNISEHIEIIINAMGNGCGSFAGAFNRIHQLQGKAVLTINLERMNIEYSYDAVTCFFHKIFIRFLKYARRGFIIQSKGKIWDIQNIELILSRLRKSPTTKKKWALFNQIRQLK